MKKILNIDRETEKGLEKYNELISTDSDLFIQIEKKFDDWIEENSEIFAMYFSDDAIYVKRDAIVQAIDSIFELMDEENLPFIFFDDPRIDVTESFI